MCVLVCVRARVCGCASVAAGQWATIGLTCKYGFSSRKSVMNRTIRVVISAGCGGLREVARMCMWMWMCM